MACVLQVHCTAVFFFQTLHRSLIYEALDPFSGAILTAMFIACAAYVAAGVCAILDLRFIAINKRRNFIITTIVRKNVKSLFKLK